MAVDKLVDSAQLDACLTAEANAIRAKTGGSANLTFDFANSKGFADEIAAIPSGGSDILGSGTVSFHTGTNSKALTIPFTSELWANNFIVEIKPIRTWALVDDVWVERDTLDFTGITGFASGKWCPLLVFVIAEKHKSPINTTYYARFLSQAQYSNGTNGNNHTNALAFDSTNNCLTFTGIDGYVCVTDGGLTFEYTIRRWSGE